MPAEGEPIGSCGGAPGNEPAYPRPGAPAHETDPTHLLLDHSLLAVGTKVLEKSGHFAQLIPNIGLDVEILAEDERPR